MISERLDQMDASFVGLRLPGMRLGVRWDGKSKSRSSAYGEG